MITDTVRAFPPVGLADLVAEAELLTRVDRKYVLPADAAARVLGLLDPRTRVLEIGGARDFGYESVYFDTADHALYRLTALSRRRRFKVRTRRYVETGTSFLEVKVRDGRGATVKERTPWDGGGLGDGVGLDAAAREFATEIVAGSGGDAALVDATAPSVMSAYRRTTLLLGAGDRATLDFGLHWRDFSGGRARLAGLVVVESKSVGRASELDRVLWASGHRPAAISKFGVGVAALNPGLPDNKWTRALRLVTLAA